MYPQTASYFFGTRLLGQGTWVHEVLSTSQAFFCASCGEIWGRILVTDAMQDNGGWAVNTVPCPKHKRTGVRDWTTIPGSFLHFTLLQKDTSILRWGQALDSMPHAVLLWELESHLNHAESSQ